jgi:hypothetical protein
MLYAFSLIGFFCSTMNGRLSIFMLRAMLGHARAMLTISHC